MLVGGDSSEEFSGFILADSILVECMRAGGVLGMILQLLYAYYAWDLTYPKQYQLLGFVQQYAIQDSAKTFHKSTNFKNLEKLFDTAAAKKQSA